MSNQKRDEPSEEKCHLHHRSLGPRARVRCPTAERSVVAFRLPFQRCKRAKEKCPLYLGPGGRGPQLSRCRSTRGRRDPALAPVGWTGFRLDRGHDRHVEVVDPTAGIKSRGGRRAVVVARCPPVPCPGASARDGLFLLG